MDNMSIYDFLYEDYKIPKDKEIDLIELFAGYGSQALSLTYLGIPFNHHFVCEFDKYAIQTYNEIHGTNFKTSDVTQITAKDLNIRSHDVATTILTYSFPCQDISLAGKQKGFERGSNTRSGLLWEVERLLKECCGYDNLLSEDEKQELNNKYESLSDEEQNSLSFDDFILQYLCKTEKIKNIDRSKLPNVTLLENVPQVMTISPTGWRSWINFLEALGYTCFGKLLNAKDYGIPQNRERCFLLSILSEDDDVKYNYKFPQPIDLKLRLKDMLEENVDEKYYLSDALLKCFMSNGTGKYPRGERFIQNINRENQDIANSVTTLAGNRATDNFVVEKPSNLRLLETLQNNELNENQIVDTYNKNVRTDGISNTITTRTDASNNTFILVPENTKKGYAEATEGDGIYIDRPHQKRGVVQKDMIPTIKANCGDIGVVVKDSVEKSIELLEDVESGKYDPNKAYGKYLFQSSKFNDKPLEEIAQTIKSSKVDSGVISNLRIRKLTPKECLRLMGVRDSDIDKITCTNTQKYKQAGNSIVVNVLMAIFKQLF